MNKADELHEKLWGNKSEPWRQKLRADKAGAQITCLSIRQPMAEAIFSMGKDIENRNWKAKVRGKVYIHAAKTFDNEAMDWMLETFGKHPDKSSMPLGGLIGHVRISDCTEQSNSKWFFGKYGFVMENPTRIPFFEMKGRLSFFKETVVLPKEPF